MNSAPEQDAVFSETQIGGRQTGARARFRRSRRRLLVGARLTWLRVSLKVLEVVAPAAADRRALELWCDLPPGSGLRRDFRPYPGDVVRVPVPRGGAVAVEVWGEGPVVYLMHGWGGWRGQLGAFVEPLAAIGHRVVAVDAPSHGDSDPSFMGRRRGTVMELMEALDAAGQQFGPAAGVIAHSLGCTVAAQVVRTSLPSERLVLIAPNHGFGEVVEQFSATLRLNPRTRDHLRASLEAITRKPIEEFDLEPLGADGSMPDTLVLHDRADKETPYRVGEALAAAWPNARLVTTVGLGHQRILADAGTVAAAVGHITDRVTAREG